jgi:catechol 2,3-dioxygenase-like lactoylglutathione lyase family enzyme
VAELTLHHLHHEAEDVDEAVKFYVDNFAGELIERFEQNGVQWARVEVADAMLNVTDRGQSDVSLGVYRGLDHVEIHTTDFDETIATLKDNGVNFFIEPMSPRPGVRIAFVSGPDNVKVEVLSVSKTG